MSVFENRIPPPIVVLIVASIMWAAARLTPHWVVADVIRVALSSAFVIAALLIGGAAFMAFRRARTTIDPVRLNAASTLVTGGIFRISRFTHRSVTLITKDHWKFMDFCCRLNCKDSKELRDLLSKAAAGPKTAETAATSE